MSRSCWPRLGCVAGLMLAPSLALAHHGQDYLLVESPGLPRPGDAYLLANGPVALAGEAEERASFEPGLLLGLTPRISLELHAHAERMADGGWSYEAIAPAVHVLLTEPGKQEGFKAGLSAEYEFAAKAGATDHLEMRLFVEAGDLRAKWTGNLVAIREVGGGSELGAALGVRHALRPGVAIGVESQGSLRHSEGAQILVAAYFDALQFGTVKVGVGGERSEPGGYVPTVHLGWVLPLHEGS